MFVSVLSDKPDLRLQFCKQFNSLSGNEDIGFYNADRDGKNRIIVEPTSFPSSIQALLHSLAVADFIILIVDQLNQHIGEIIIALDLLKKDHGILVSSISMPSGTVLDKYYKTTDINAAKDKILELSTEQNEEEPFALIDRSQSLPNMGNVALGVVKSGKIKKDETLLLLPDKKELSIRSILINDKVAEQAKAGDRFGVSYKGDIIERGMLVPLRNSFELSASINGKFMKSPFFKDELNHKIHAYHNYQFVEGKVFDNELRLDKPMACRKGDRILVVDPSNQKLRIAGAFISSW